MTRLVPQWPGMDPGEAGGGCFPRAVAPKVSPSKISMVIRSCTAPAPPYLRAWIAKHCHAARHRRSSSLLPWVFARCETMLRGDIPRTGLFAHPRHRHPYPIRRARLLQWNDRTIEVPIDPRRAKSLIRCMIHRKQPMYRSDRSLFFVFLEFEILFDSKRGIFYIEETR